VNLVKPSSDDATPMLSPWAVAIWREMELLALVELDDVIVDCGGARDLVQRALEAQTCARLDVHVGDAGPARMREEPPPGGGVQEGARTLAAGPRVRAVRRGESSRLAGRLLA
jgi:hypothetical protein